MQNQQQTSNHLNNQASANNEADEVEQDFQGYDQAYTDMRANEDQQM